jgi:septum formation protein
MNKIFSSVEKFILASGSPRRRDFLEGLGIAFEVLAAEVDESPFPDEIPEVFVRRLAEEKARAVSGQDGQAWVLGADTVVAIEGKMLGKPESATDACRMLECLNGRWHEVWTGFCLCHGDKVISRTRAVRTEVLFGNYPMEVLKAYVASGEPLDKAGAYGIQALGGFLVKEVKGSYSNVVGLPLAEVVNELISLGIIRPHGG